MYIYIDLLGLRPFRSSILINPNRFNLVITPYFPTLLIWAGISYLSTMRRLKNALPTPLYSSYTRYAVLSTLIQTGLRNGAYLHLKRQDLYGRIIRIGHSLHRSY